MYKIGDKFIASKDYLFNIKEAVEKGEDRYDIMDGEEFEIVDIKKSGLYKAHNISCDSNVCTLMTDKDIKQIITE
jgi:hypothetical protein